MIIAAIRRVIWERNIPANGNAQSATPKLLTVCLLSPLATDPCIAKIAIGK